MNTATQDATQPGGLMPSAKLRDLALVTLWFAVTFKQFQYDELLLYPLALYFTWAFIRDFDEIFPILLHSFILFLFPIWWLLSASWGLEPGLILKSGLQLTLSMMICYCIIIRLEARDIAIALLLAAAWYGVASFVEGIIKPAKIARGVFASKNAMGTSMVVLWAASLTLILDRSFPGWLRILTIGLAALALRQVIVSHSATAVLLVIGVTLLFFVFGVLAQSRVTSLPVFFVTVCLGVAVLLGLGAAFLALSEVDPVTAVLQAFGKDATLTGRTDLWRYAEEQIARNPLLGVGHGGYWRPDDWTSDARKIFIEFHKAYYARFSFHNSFYEIAVHQGLIGLGITVLTVLWAMGRIIWDVFRRNSMQTVFFFGMASVTLARAMTEADLMQPFVLLSMVFFSGALMSVKEGLREPMLVLTDPILENAEPVYFSN